MLFFNYSRSPIHSKPYPLLVLGPIRQAEGNNFIRSSLTPPGINELNKRRPTPTKDDERVLVPKWRQQLTRET